MAATETDELRGHSDQGLREKVKQATERLRAIREAPDPGTRQERERVLEEMDKYASVATAARRELSGREVERGISATKQRQLDNWLASDDNSRPHEAARKALTIWRGEFPAPLRSAEMDARRLTDKEGRELLALTREAFKPGLAPGSKKRLRLEQLLEKCAGASSGAIEQARKPPPRPPLPEMRTRAVLLPTYLFAWSVADPRHTGFSTFRAGVLAKILAGLANGWPVLVRSRFEEVDGEPFLVCASGERLRVDAGDGSLEQPQAVQWLVDQRLLSRERTEAGEVRIGLGERLRKFRDAQEGGEADGS